MGFRSGEVSKGGVSKDWKSTERIETYLQIEFKEESAQILYSQSIIPLEFVPFIVERSLLMSIGGVINPLIKLVGWN